MLGICQSDNGGGGGEFWAGGAAVDDDPPLVADAALAETIALCSIFWLDVVELLDCAACCDWEDTPAAAAAAAATANADKSFLFFLLRFRVVVAPMASTHITCCVWFFCVLLNLQAGDLVFGFFWEIKTQNKQKKKRNETKYCRTKHNEIINWSKVNEMIQNEEPRMKPLAWLHLVAKWKNIFPQIVNDFYL